ncbi:coiled-coil domain-containing protein 80 [Pseudorasbora parva]|uniref:coiled-coil domain-containing protein 80 n=1 Tax=Pseudorasbora parva TaxID=51549 RepID=UPI00351E4C13
MSRLWILLVLLAHWINSPVLSAKVGKKKHQAKTPKEDIGSDGARESPTESDFLADFSGKHRLWVITAPSHGDNYLRMMEKQIQESEGLNCRLAERDTLVVTIIQNAMMEGKIQRTTLHGEATVEVMDSEMVSKLLHYLELEDHTFSMLILKKNMRVSERFPYPVRVEAVLEVIDQLPVRKLERVARKGLPVKCKITKKRLVMKKQGSSKRRTFSPQRQMNTTSILTQKIHLDKKATLRNKVQDILNGRSRFVIRKPGNVKPSSKAGSESGSNGNERLKHGDQKKTPDSDRNREPTTEVKKPEAERKHASTKSNFDTLNEDFKGEQTVDHSASQKKGKGKDGKKKKGKGGRRKSQREADDKEKAALKEFMQNLKGRRRLLVISSPSDVSSQYIKQRDDNELRSCEFSQRKVSVLSIMGSDRSLTLHIQHYQASEAPGASLPEKFRNSELIGDIRREYGLDSKNFSMVLTDYDLRPNLNRVFSKPTAPSDLLDYIDSFPSRQSEKEEERKAPSRCSKDETNNQENSLLRFMSKRRLLIISAPSVDDYSFHQQLQALNGQECPMGIRHFALLKIVGTGSTASGTVEFFPLNGKSQPEKETISQNVVESLRNQLKINRDYFSMLVVGKDGDVKAWFPSPLWSLGSIYDLVDSMELRQQEQKLQQTLGIHCPDENTGTYHGYTEETEDSYLYHRSED